jgi:hypothetical protein
LRHWGITVESLDPYAAVWESSSATLQNDPQWSWPERQICRASRPCCCWGPCRMPHECHTDGCDPRPLASRPRLQGDNMRLAYPKAQTSSRACSSERSDTSVAAPYYV